LTNLARFLLIVIIFLLLTGILDLLTTAALLPSLLIERFIVFLVAKVGLPRDQITHAVAHVAGVVIGGERKIVRLLARAEGRVPLRQDTLATRRVSSGYTTGIEPSASSRSGDGWRKVNRSPRHACGNFVLAGCTIKASASSRKDWEF
jgi:hypothetical protein